MSQASRTQSRHWVRAGLTALLVLSLAACARGTPVSRLPTPPDPAPIPARKPPVPAEFLLRKPAPPPVAPSASLVQPRQSSTLPLPRRNPVRNNAAARQTTPTPPPAAPAPSSQVRPATAQTAAAGGNARAYVVQPGENVFSIARKLNVPIRSLLEINRLGPPYKLTTGQRLLVPIPTRHIVTRGETVYAISRRYGVDIRSLVQLNRIPPPYRISVGQVLDLPGALNAFAAATPQPAPTPSAPSQPSGQSSGQPSGQPGGQPGGQPQTALAPGSPVGVPVPTPKPRVTGNSHGSSQSAPAPVAKPQIPKAQPAKPQAAKPQAAKPQIARVQPPKPSRRPAAGVPKPPPRASSKFRWPLSGKIISSFGSKGSGVHNDGINIEASAGTIVRAAENGVIAYSGNELRGFGRLLLIRHADGWVTAYAHLGEVLVNRGQTVKRGEAIAKVGRSGNVSRPQLHFEIRQGTRAVDPRKLLGPQQAVR